MEKLIKFIGFTFLFVFIITTGNSQKNIQLYYENVNKAELAICDSNFKEAAHYYASAFSYESPFNKDLIMAKYISFLICDFEKAFNYSVLLKKRGCNITYQIDSLNQLYYNNLKVIIDTTVDISNHLLQLQIDSLKNEDQRIRKQENLQNRLVEIRIIDSTIFSNLIIILNQTFSRNEKIVDQNIYSAIHLIFIHNLKALENFDSLAYDVNPKNILMNAVINGLFDAREYAQIYDFYQARIDARDSTTSTMFYGMCSLANHIINNTLFIYYPPYIEELNQNRKVIYLEEYNDYILKIINQFYFPQFSFYTEYKNQYTDIIQMEIDEKKVFDKYNGKNGMKLIYYSRQK
jgi:hypothetical protein